MRSLLKLKPNEPVEIALGCGEGVNVVSPRGTPAVKYTLVDGRTFYATQHIVNQLKSMRIEPNERIRLCIQKIDGRNITVVERATDTPAEPGVSIDPCSPASSENANSPNAVTGAAGAHPNGNEKSAAPEDSNHSPARESQNGEPPSHLICELKLVNKGGEPATRRITHLERALKTAILASYYAEQFGQKIGYPIRFDQESIKSMAVTLLIGMQGRS